METHKAVILAAGRGTRMQRPSETALLSDEQRKVAESGVKALMPVGRPFIDYTLSALGNAGYRKVCIVVGPGHQTLRDHCDAISGGRFDIEFAVQAEPLGTANAIAAAAAFAAYDPFLMINSDNYYPQSALTGMRSLNGSAVAAFTTEGIAGGNIPAERVRNFALLKVGVDGSLERVIEKPDPSQVPVGQILVGMNCWRFTPTIFEACRSIPLSSRKEYELTDAVAYSIERLNERFEAVVVNEPVLDLSSQADVAEVTIRLANVEVRL